MGDPRGPSTRARTKPEIYKTVDGKVIVEDELLNFLAVKIKTLSQDEIVLLTTKTFDSDGIEASKKVLFELCPNSQVRCVAHKGVQKDANNIKSCLKVMNELGDKIPRFVSYYLDELPPVTFSSMDVSSLLGKMEQMYTEVCTLTRVVQLQADVSAELRVFSGEINRRVGVLEGPSDRLDDPIQVAGPDETAGLDGGADVVAEAAGLNGAAMVLNGTTEVAGVDVLGAEVAVHATVAGVPARDGPGGMALLPVSPKWARVVKNGRRQLVPEKAAVRTGMRSAVPGRKKRSNAVPIVGTGAVSNIQTIKTRLVSVFASRFSPDLDANVLSAYLKDKLCREVTCNKIDTFYSRFSSFKVSAECNDIGDMYNPELWPDGALVRRYYEPRRPGALAASSAVEGGTSVPANTGSST